MDKFTDSSVDTKKNHFFMKNWAENDSDMHLTIFYLVLETRLSVSVNTI